MAHARRAPALPLLLVLSLAAACTASTAPMPPEPPPGDEEATCAPEGTCIAAGQPCQFTQQCCSGTCGPPGVAAPTCFECKPGGTSCSGPGDATCCFGTSCTLSGAAGGYACVAVTPETAPCRWPGAKCSEGSECCTGVCEKNKCAPCPPCPPDMVCECGPMCLAPGEVCQVGAQCCGPESCVPDTGGTLRCAGCFPDGTSCSAWSECCSQWCEDGVCGVPPACAGWGEACTASADCCVDLACEVAAGETTGACAPPCALVGGRCTVDGHCCSGRCDFPPEAPIGACACGSGP